MPRFVFPEDRLSFVYTRPGNPLLEPSGQQGIQVFLEPECDTLALISSTDKHLIPNSTIYVGPDSLMPFFYGPPDVKILYARAIGHTSVYPLNALDASRLGEFDRHDFWEAETLPTADERRPPFIWVKPSDGSVYLVVEDGFADLYHDVYSDFYGSDAGWIR